MSKKLLPLALAAIALGGCANTSKTPDASAALGQDKNRIVGIWAMMPLRNGIANVAEYKPDGKVLLHPFNCVENNQQPVEVSDYKVADNGQSIHIQSPHDSFDLKVLKFSPKAMQLGMDVGGQQLTFSYLKVAKVASLCGLYPNAKAEQARHSPYQSSDFVPAPQVPAHANLERYLGKWAIGKAVQLEIRRDPQGNAYVYQASSENWNHLYNDVHWEGDALHFQSYAYSDKESLFRHPYHKSNTGTILQPLADGKLRYVMIIGGKPAEETLVRVD